MKHALAASLTLSVLACEPSTGGRAVDVTFTVRGASDEVTSDGSVRRFSTFAGWEVELEEAWVAVGPFVVWENPPPLASSAPSSAPESKPSSLWDLLVPDAHAHPGDTHFNGGNAKAEWMGQTLLDALSPEPQRFAAPGVAGPARSVTIHLEPPRADLQGGELLSGDHLRARGTATKDGQSLRFVGGIVLPPEGGRREINGIPVEGDVDEDVEVALVVDPAAWFVEVDFSELSAVEPDADGFRTIPVDGSIAAAWEIGARSLTSGTASPSAAAASLEVGR
jgi:hypothetical protein